ncbi:septum site-determining protein MinC [Buchnera aphidicola]|uniref:Probable septum site-determining protein MinC n=1 Tax=Buchnera aphidicola (Cinara strobi) TaxID=1921549 RepID=A0A3B1DWB8_9GAMM|nr:septum site-determining protein MinC [Buchnera aphidicola]VAX76583.1 Septum site-determining protein MinC [Buchnera aphidicola (Cinara strobi)]
MKDKLITFKKNNFTVLVIYLNNITFNCFKKFLLKKITESPNFFKDIPILLHIKRLSCSFDWINIKRFILSIGLFLIGITGYLDKNLKNIILQSGITIFPKKKKICKIYKNNYFTYPNNKKSKTLSISSKIIENQKSYLVSSLVRSGQKIYTPNTDLIITNNVSSGAELIAGGNVHIYGIMRGRVLAGVNGDVTRKIFCTQLFAELIAIAGKYWTIEKIPNQFIGKSVEISLINKAIYIKRFN